MLERIPDLPDDVVGVIATGEIAADDYDIVLVPAVEAAIGKHGHVRLVYQLGPGFSSFSAGAMWDDAKLGMMHLGKWKKIAVVTDLAWVSGMIRALGFAIPCPARVFSNDALAEAIAWVSID